MDEKNEHIYIFVDDRNRIIDYKDGTTIPEDVTNWIFIPRNEKEKYNLNQSHCFEGGLYTPDGIPMYKWEDDMVISRTADEVAADWIKLDITTEKGESNDNVQNSD